MLNLTEKLCRRCNTVKPITEFNKEKGRKDGVCFECRACRSKRRKQPHYRINERESNKKWRHRTIHLRREEQFVRNLRRKFNMKPEEYWQMFEEQNKGCAICRKPNSKSGKKLAVDHCHSTNKIRGLLCNECNTGLGLFDDKIEFLRSAIVYLRLRGEG